MDEKLMENYKLAINEYGMIYKSILNKNIFIPLSCNYFNDLNEIRKYSLELCETTECILKIIYLILNNECYWHHNLKELSKFICNKLESKECKFYNLEYSKYVKSIQNEEFFDFYTDKYRHFPKKDFTLFNLDEFNKYKEMVNLVFCKILIPLINEISKELFYMKFYYFANSINENSNNKEIKENILKYEIFDYFKDDVKVKMEI